MNAVIPNLAAPELKRRLDRGEALALLDVREPEERACCALSAPDGMVDLHVPLSEVPARLAEIRSAGRDRTLVVYCHHGVRSLLAARWLASQGLDRVANLKGGIDAWSVEVDPSLPRY